LSRVSPRNAFAFWLLAVTATLGVGGCAAIAVPAIGAAALSSGVGSLVKSGTEYTLGGVAYRTFPGSLRDVYAAVRTTFSKLEFEEPDEKINEERVRLQYAGIGREVRVDLMPITPGITQMRMIVRKEFIGKDRATASAILDEIADALKPAASERASTNHTAGCETCAERPPL
jgi:uncharacterized protein DUF3568